MRSDPRRAVIDLGSRTFHMQLFRHDGHRLVSERAWKESPRLSAHLRDGRLQEQAIAEARAAMVRLGDELDRYAPGCPVSVVATGALRAASNRTALTDWARAALGWSIEVLSGCEEARLAYAGAIHSSDVRSGSQTWVVDLGGGSTELAMGYGHRCERLHSVALGALELSSRYVGSDRVLDERARFAIVGEVRTRLQSVTRDVALMGTGQVILACGAARALGRFGEDLGLHRSGNPLERAILARMVTILSQFRPTEMTTLGIEDARSDTIAVAALVLVELLAVMGVECAFISNGGLREGVALRELRSPIASFVRPGICHAVT